MTNRAQSFVTLLHDTFATLALLAVAGCSQKSSPSDVPIAKPDDTLANAEILENLSAGAATVFDRSSRAFAFPATNLTPENQARHIEADALFGAKFVTGPAPINAGLGPFFNNVSCEGCHIGNGRGAPIAGSGPNLSQLVLRLSIAGVDAVTWGPKLSPIYGTQLKDHAVYGQNPQGSVQVDWITEDTILSNGRSVSLRRPNFVAKGNDGVPMPSEILKSFRVPPAVFGAGLLEAIPEADIVAGASLSSPNKRGVGGKVNRVWNFEKQQTQLGRFGRKANVATLIDQTAAAFHKDMGLSNTVFPAGDGNIELDQKSLELTAFYPASLGVPARVNSQNPIVKQGEKIFDAIGCTSCHRPTWQTGTHPIAELSNLEIHPYTDLLLHDMGPGLADNRPDYLASGSDWKTPPLWGIGLTQTVFQGAGYLHDGRAKTLEEAILWHGGEAASRRAAYEDLDDTSQYSLLAFLQSL